MRDKQYCVESRLYLNLRVEHATMATAMAQWAAARRDTMTGYGNDGNDDGDNDGGGREQQQRQWQRRDGRQ